MLERTGRAMPALLLVAGAALAIVSVACATGGGAARPPEAHRSAPADRGPVLLPVGHPIAPEAEPENVERRFGYAEARARRDRERQAAQRQKQVDYLGPTATPPAAGAGAAQDRSAAPPPPPAAAPAPPAR